jgi:integrase
MGNVQKRPDGKWRARWRDPSGKERAKHFDKKGDATRFLATVESSKLSGSYVNPADRTTVSEYARRWAEIRHHRPATARRVTQTLSAHVHRTWLGGRRLSSVLPSDAQAWVALVSDGRAPSTVRTHVNLMRSIFRSAVKDRIIASNAFDDVTLPREERERVVPLTVAQVRELGNQVPDRCAAMVVVQAGCGLRLGELLALRVEDVDFLRREVSVTWQMSQVTGERVPPKTPRSRRTVPLPDVVAQTLAAHIAAYPPLPDGTIFSTPEGRPWRHLRYGRIFRSAVAASGLPAGTSSHALRHHYASVLLHAGESEVAVAERLGHDNSTLVRTTYGHLMPNSEDRTRRAVDDAWRADSADSMRTGGAL